MSIELGFIDCVVLIEISVGVGCLGINVVVIMMLVCFVCLCMSVVWWLSYDGGIGCV